MAKNHLVLRLNILCGLLVALLMLWTKLSNWPVKELFLFPFFSPQPTDAFLTRTFQLLCAVPPIVCAFSYGLLRRLQPHHPDNRFILGSAVITGAFLVNEIYRLHLYLRDDLGVSKVAVSLVYACFLGYYSWVFRREISATPYKVLLAGIALLFFAILIDTLHLRIKVVASLLEGLPKLFSEINVAIYYWLVSKQAVENSLVKGNNFREL